MTPARAEAAPLPIDASVTVELEVPSSDPGAVARLVTAGLAARRGFDSERIDDFTLALDAVLFQAPARDTLTLAVAESPATLGVSVGPLAAQTFDRPATDRVLSALVDEIHTSTAGDELWLDLRVALPVDAAGR